VHLNQIVNKRYAHQVLLHASALQNKIDNDQDAFLDLPLKRQYNGMYRGFYSNNNIEGQLFIHALTERRQSGQLSEQNPVRNPFLIDVENKRVSVTGKLGYLGFKKPYNSFGSQWSATYHDVDALYGRNRYNGEQRSFYANLIYATIISTTDNKLNIGGSVQYDDYKEYLNDRDLSRTDILTGAFGEYTYSRPVLGKGYNDITFIAGLRADYHQKFKTFVSPRLNFKYNFNEGDVIRVSAGRGVRVANPIAENIAFLATNRTIVIGNDLKPEDAWNFGLNAVKTFKIADREWRLSADVYRTQFVNQIIADIESDYKTAQFYNLDGKSYSNVFLTMLNAQILRGLDLKLTYKLNDVKTTYKNRLDEVPLVARHRALASIDFRTPNKKWLFTWTSQLIGQQRLADRTYVPSQYHHDHDGLSPTYSISHFSVNYLLKKIEVYGGAENLFNYTQHSPIIAWQDPTSEYFDATQVYAPMMGRRLYIGLRWRMGEHK
jgi:outer membrane receptor for ferrienterochelin and colicins